MKRIVLFIVTNLAVMLVLSIAASVLTSAVRASAAKRFLTGASAIGGNDSTSVFQALQAGHLPSHLGLTSPHSEQV